MFACYCLLMCLYDIVMLLNTPQKDFVTGLAEDINTPGISFMACEMVSFASGSGFMSFTLFFL